MKTKLYLLFFVILSSMVLQAQNTITMVNPPTTVQAGTDVDITFNYTLDIDGYAFLRLKDASGNLTEISKLLSAGSGTETLALPIPADALGDGYSYQAQLFDHNNGWANLATEDLEGITVASAPPAANSITMVSPPTTATAGANVDITFNYTVGIAEAYAFIRLKNASGNLTEVSKLLTAGSGTETLSLPIPADALGSGYSYQAQLFDHNNGWANLATEDLEGITVTSGAPAANSITIVNPPKTVTAGTKVDITLSYKKDVAVGYALVRFKNAAGENLEQIFAEVTDDAGSVTLSLQAPATEGSDYSYQAQLFSGDWGHLATENVEGITVTSGTAAPNSITMVSPPTTVTAGTDVDITFNYTLDIDGYAFIRLKDASGNLTDVNKLLSAGSGTETLALPIPADAQGAGYSYQAQLFDHNNGWANLATEDIEGITVEAGTAAPNSITMVSPPTTVTAGANVDITFNYTLAIDAHAFIRFKDASGNLTDVNKILNAGSGTETLSLPIPGDAQGAGYSYQAQLFDHNNGYANLATENVEGITVEAYTPSGENTLEIVDTSTDPINNGTLRRVNVKYNLLQKSKILVEVRDNEVAAGSNKIGEIWVEVPAGNQTIGLDLIVNKGWPGDTNRIQAILFKEGTSWETISIPEVPHIIVAKGDGTITYRGQPFVGDGSQNKIFTQPLGEGYYTNYYIANGWKGPLQTKFGPVGSPSWIEYQNENPATESHKEFDIKIQKFSWHEGKDNVVRGYPKALKDIDFPLETTLEGQWSPGSGGRGQINMTAWVTENGDFSGKRIDIIVHAFDNSGNFRKKYDDQVGNYRNIGEFTSNNGLTYQILRSFPGALGEVASYNLVPDAIVQADPRADYTNDVIKSTIDMKDIIDNLIAKESTYTGDKVPINENWKINGLEWTVVGQSEHADADGQIIPSGHGKFTFNSYTIPDLVKSLSTDDFDATLKNLTIFPNPFKDSFTYKYDSALSDSVSVELFTIDGRRIKTIKNDTRSNGGTIYTGHLSNGIYIVRITSGNGQETRKLIKN